MKHLPMLSMLAIGVIALAGCSRNVAQTPESKSSGDRISLTTEMNAQLPLTAVSEQPGRSEISLSGKIEFDPTSVTRVFPIVSGVYNHIYVLQGAIVKKGQVLADVYSPDVAVAISDFQKASAALRNAGKELERQRHLFTSNLAAEKDVQQAESDAAQAQADYDRSLHTLNILGCNEKTTSPLFQIVAPISGMVIESFAQPGAQVRSDGSTVAFTVGNTSTIWIVLDAYADQLRSLSVGDTAIVRASGSEDHPFLTTIQYINPVVDPTTFTTKIRCILPNATGELKPAMFVSATVYHPSGRGLYLPSTAVFLGSDGKHYAFAKRGERQYQKVEVEIGKAEPSRDEIVGGLSVGDTVVADKALFLNDELASDQK